MNRQTTLSVLAAAAFGLAMASTSIASAVDNGQTPSERARCESIVNQYFACIAGCESLPPSQLRSCEQACWTQELDACGDTHVSQSLNSTRVPRTVRPQATLQTRR